jgi:hypothetical protein
VAHAWEAEIWRTTVRGQPRQIVHHYSLLYVACWDKCTDLICWEPQKLGL